MATGGKAVEGHSFPEVANYNPKTAIDVRALSATCS